MADAFSHSAKQNRSSKMMKDMGIYAIGNLGSKIITFLMVPLYTYYVENTADFGYYDICLTAVFLLMPFVTLQLRDGAFRIASFFQVRYLWYVLALLVAMSIQEVVSQVFRGLGNNKAFITVGILSAFFIGLFSLVFVVWLGMGIEGVFIANILARFAAVGAVELKLRTLQRFFFVKISILTLMF